MPVHQDDIAEILVTQAQIQQRVRQLAEEIAASYSDRHLLLVAVLKGSVLFLADLMRELCVPHSIDFMATSSYGAATQSSGVVRIIKDLDEPIEGKDVLLVEDIIDSGNTLYYLLGLLQARNPRSLRIVTLLDKPTRRKIDVPVDWVGFSIPDKFVVGYGLDFAERYRNLPYIGVLRPELYTGGAII